MLKPSKPLSFRCVLLLAVVSGLLIAGIARARSADCLSGDDTAIRQAIGTLSSQYNDVPSCLACDTQKTPIERMICRHPRLKLMEVLDTKAAVYAFENAAARQTRHSRPDCSFIAQELSTCTDEHCACKRLKAHTNDSLGGSSPYSREAN